MSTTIMSDNNYSRCEYRLIQYGLETIAIVHNDDDDDDGEEKKEGDDDDDII